MLSLVYRYYFVVEEDNTPLSVTVTPCDAPLEWKLTLQDLPEESSGEASGITDSKQAALKEVNDMFCGNITFFHSQLTHTVVFWLCVLVGFN